MSESVVGEPRPLDSEYALSFDFLSQGGEMGALMRAHDWSTSALGPPQEWPQSLRTVVRIMLNTGHPMYIFWGAEGSCLYNDAYRESIGNERHPCSLGRPAREVWDEIWEIIGPQIEQVLSGGGATWNVNHLVPITRHGRREEVYWTYSYSPIDDSAAARGIGGVLVVCSETTEQVLAARQLAEARDKADSDAQQLNLALEAARLGDWRWDAATDIVTFSERAAAIFGIPAGPLMTWAAMRELLHPDDRERARLAVEGAIASNTDYLTEYRLINDNRERWISVSGRARFDDSGTVLGMLGVVQDITADRFLVHLDDVVRLLSDPQEITFTAARLLGAHLRVNRCAYAAVEDDQDTFVLTGNYVSNTHSIIGRYTFRQFGAACLALMRTGLPYVVEDSENDVRIDKADRIAYRATAIRAVICVPILKSGRFVAAMAVHQTSARRWTEAETELLQQVASRCWESIERARFEREQKRLLALAEEANRAKDEFLAMLGHELRNPLSPILTALEIMKLRETESSARERTIIERQVSHLTRLVDDLLDVSRIARGKVELKSERVEIADVVRRAMEMSSPLFEQRSQLLAVELDATPMTVLGDSARLDQVLANLLTNASKYTPHRGRILVRAGLEGSDVLLSVEDDGIGIAEEVLPQIFDMFVQGRQALDRSEGGLGLGLAIVRSLVQRHGGTVSAGSAGIGKGSRFVVRLPQAAATSAEPEASTQPGQLPALAPVARKIVLVVDDNEDAAELLAHALRMMGHEAETAHDGGAALSSATRRSFDAAFLDIGLPVMDGYELASRLRATPGQESLLLFALTGYGQASDLERSRLAGFHRHLVKPVDLDTIERLLESSSSSRSGSRAGLGRERWER